MSAIELVSAQFSAPDEATTCALAAQLAKNCVQGDCVLLNGELGAGKTAFARGFIHAFNPGAEVVSPTFNLVQTYDNAHATLWHFDLYRLKTAAELVEIGLDEALEFGITLIEWPQLAKAHWPHHALAITFQSEGQGRLLTFTGPASRWKNHLPI